MAEINIAPKNLELDINLLFGNKLSELINTIAEKQKELKELEDKENGS